MSTLKFYQPVSLPGMILRKALDFSTFVPSTETDGSLMTTHALWPSFSSAGQCGLKLLLANASAAGNFATVRFRARSDVATPTWNTNTIACDLSASANVADYGELLGISSYAQDNGHNQARSTHWALAGKFCNQHTGTSAGSRYAIHVTDYCSTKAATAHYLARFDKPSGAQAIDGVFNVGNCDQFSYLFNFEITGGMLSSSDTRLAVHTAAGVKYIHLESS